MIASVLVIKDTIGREEDTRTDEIQELKGEILELKVKVEGFMRDSEESKRDSEESKRDREELKRDMEDLKRLTSQHVEATATKIEAVEREIRDVLLEGTGGFISRQKYAPARARLERVSQDSVSTPPNRSVVSEHAELQPDFRQLAKRYSAKISRCV